MNNLLLTTIFTQCLC